MEDSRRFWMMISFYLGTNIESYFHFQCLLTDKEVEIKTKIWMEENKEYLEMLKGSVPEVHQAKQKNMCVSGYRPSQSLGNRP